MRNSRSLVARRTLSGVMAALTIWFLSTSTPAAAQQGQDAVYNVSQQVTNSRSFIDASQFIGTGNNLFPDICSALNFILNPLKNVLPASGGVVDARGISGATALTCSGNPWAGINAVPSTILLPAGTIKIPATWILPSNTRLIGEGEGVPCSFGSCSSFAPGTTIQATPGFSGTMMQFGPCGTLLVCTGISVERLTLDGQAQAVHGIVNQYSQNNTRVDHVTIYQIRGTGLLVSHTSASSARNSAMDVPTPTTASADANLGMAFNR